MSTMIAVPCLDMIQVSFASSLIQMLGSGVLRDVSIAFEAGSLVHEARNRLALKAINEGYERVLWLDSDMVFTPELAEKLSEDLDEGRDFVSAVYFMRRLPTKPMIAKSLDWYEHDTLGAQEYVEIYEDYPKEQIFAIAGCGFGAVMMKTELLKQIAVNFRCGPFTPMPRLSEDYSICWRLKQMGVDMYADSRIPVGHCGMKVYGPQDYTRSDEKP